MRFTLILLVLCLFLIVVDAKKMLKKMKKKTPVRNRAADPSKATGACEADGTCKDKTQVCQKSDTQCYPAGTPGLDGTGGGDDKKGSSSSSSCKNKNAQGRASDCPMVAYLCNNPVYNDLMTDQCPVTCKRGCAAAGATTKKPTS